MITNAWMQSAHSHTDTPLPASALFHSSRGQLIVARPTAPSDASMIGELLAGLSAQSLFLRYCMPMPRMAPETVAREIARLEQANSTRQLTVVALASIGDVEQVIAVAELMRDAGSPDVAEIALVVADAYQRAGIGSALCMYLGTAAQRQGLATLRAMALAENAAVRRMVARSGAPYTAETRQGMTTIQIDLRNASHGAALI